MSSYSDDLLLEHADVMLAAGKAENAEKLSRGIRLGWLFPEGGEVEAPPSLEGLSESDKELVGSMPKDQAQRAASLVAQYRRMTEQKAKTEK